jgi:hypothetical protein
MSQTGRFLEIIEQYTRHGWQLRSVLARPATLSALAATGVPGEVGLRESDVDAMWFSRPSYQGREAWELRLVGDTPYALFETFEPDEPEEDRDEVRLDMEARLRDYAGRGKELGLKE